MVGPSTDLDRSPQSSQSAASWSRTGLRDGTAKGPLSTPLTNSLFTNLAGNICFVVRRSQGIVSPNQNIPGARPSTSASAAPGRPRAPKRYERLLCRRGRGMDDLSSRSPCHGMWDRRQAEEALPLLDDALQLVEKTGERWFAAELNRHKGQLLLRQGHAEAAEELYCKALSIAKEQEAKLWELRAAVSLARALPRPGPPFRSPRSSRADPRLVHRGFRHARPQRGEGTAGRAGVSLPDRSRVGSADLAIMIRRGPSGTRRLLAQSGRKSYSPAR
jgi:hypothetical protein